jgi:DNA-binding NarL/FixJ family response regulator
MLTTLQRGFDSRYAFLGYAALAGFARHPGARIIALTASIDEARMMGVLRAGAARYVRKDAEPETLLAAVRAVPRDVK